MRTRCKALAALVPMALLSGCTAGKPGAGPLKVTAEPVDYEQYIGTWYEIARVPTPFQRDCVASRAMYSLTDEGKIRVVNECRRRTLDGPVSRIEGVAWPPDPSEPAKLKVKFDRVLFTGDYWIIGLDPQYEWAIVGEPMRRYLWLLSRTPTVSMERYRMMTDVAEAHGYDTSKLILTPQTPSQEALRNEEAGSPVRPQG